MRNILIIAQKETAAFLNSLIAYVVITVFLTGIGLFFWIFNNNILDTGAADLNTLFLLGPWFFLFLIPAITMRAFADEIRSGTLDLLLSRPVTIWQILWGKFLASCILVFFALLPTLCYYFSISWLGNPPGNLDTGATWGAYLGLLMLGCSFAAIGLFTSALTDNTIIAFIFGAFLCFFFYTGFDLLAELPILSKWNESIIKWGMIEHFRSISRGVVDSRDIIYFASISYVFLFLSDLKLSARKR